MVHKVLQEAQPWVTLEPPGSQCEPIVCHPGPRSRCGSLSLLCSPLPVPACLRLMRCLPDHLCALFCFHLVKPFSLTTHVSVFFSWNFPPLSRNALSLFISGINSVLFANILRLVITSCCCRVSLLSSFRTEAPPLPPDTKCRPGGGKAHSSFCVFMLPVILCVLHLASFT